MRYDKLSQIPNPFPQMGTAASMGSFFEPIGYSEEIKEIKEAINENYNSQALIFNIVGRYGYGKTHFLHFFKKVYENDFQIYEFNLDNFQNLGPFFLEKVNDFNQNSKDKKGIIFFIDETQNIHEQENKEQLREFQDFLKNFPDAKLRNRENEYINIGESLKKIIVFFALHPQTAKKIFTQKQDIGDRCLTHRLELKELNYYSAYKIIQKFLEYRGQKIGEWLDKDVIPLIFCLTPFITTQRHEIIHQLNPRIFIEIFYQIFEYWRAYYRKGEILTVRKFVDLLRDEVISIGTASEELNQAILKFNDKEKFENIYNSITDINIKDLILSPKWNKLEDHFQETLNENKDYFDIKEGYVLTEEKLTIAFIRNLQVDNQLKEQIKLIPKIKIYFKDNPENLTYLVFNNDLKGPNYNELKDFFKNNSITSGKFFRLNSEYLKIFYDYEDKQFEEIGLYNYLNSDDKVKFFYDQFKKDLIVKKFSRLGIFQKIKNKQVSYSNLVQQNIIKPYITIESKIFDFINKWEIYNIFFFTKDEIETLQQFYDALIEEQKNDVNVCDIIILEPFIGEYNLNPSVLKDFFIDKTVIFKPNIDEFKQLLSDQIKIKKKIIHSYLNNARKNMISMLIEKNFIIPLSNIIIGKGFDQHLTTFSEIICKALTNKIELSYSPSLVSEEKSYSLQDIKNWLVFKTDINTGLETLSRFFHIDIRKDKYYFRNLISDYEIKFLKLLIYLSKNNNKIIQTDTFLIVLDKIITVSTRIDILEFIKYILIEKEILNVEELDGKGFYTFKHPEKIIQELIKKLGLIIKFDLSQDEIQRYKLIINVLDGFLTDEDIKTSYFDLDFNNLEKVKSILNKFSFYNYYCKKIEESLKQRYISPDNDLIVELSIKIQNIIENLSKIKTVKSDVNEEKSFSLSTLYLILLEISDYKEIISVLFGKLNKVFNNNKQYKTRNSSEKSEKIIKFELELSYNELFDILNFIFILYFHDENLNYEEFFDDILETEDKLDLIISKLKCISDTKELSNYFETVNLTEEIKLKFDKIFQDLKTLRDIFNLIIEEYKEREESEEFEDGEIEEGTEGLDDEDFEELNLDFEEEEESEETEEEYEDILVSINLIENYYEFIKIIDEEISNKKNIYDDLIENIIETLKKVKTFETDKQPLFKDLNFIIALKNNNLITHDRLLQNLFNNFNLNCFYFNYQEEFETFHRLLISNTPLSQFYNNYISKMLKIANQENEYLSEFILICKNLNENEIVNEIYGLLNNFEEGESKELDFNSLTEIQQFTCLYLYISKNDFARNFLYYLIFNEIKQNLHNIIVIDDEKIDFSVGFNDFYKQCVMNKKKSIVFKYDPESKKDIESDPETKYILASKEDIAVYYSKIIKEKEIDKQKVLEIMNHEYPPYLLFKYYNKGSKLKTYYCPLEFEEKLPFLLNYFEKDKLELILEEILEDYGLNHNIGLIQLTTNKVNEIIDENQNTFSMNFRHPLLELKKSINENQFGISTNSESIDITSSSNIDVKDIKKKLIQLNRNLNEILNDIIKDLLINDFNLEKCFPKTNDFFKYNPSIKLEKIKVLCEFFSNNLEEIRKFLRSDD